MKNSINPRYFPRTLGVYFGNGRTTTYRMLYPFRNLAAQGYPVGWNTSVRGVNLDVYDLVLFLRTPNIDEEELVAQVQEARHAGKIVILDNAAPGFPDVPVHGVIIPDSTYMTGGNPHCIVDTGIDPSSWPATERWTQQKTIGLFTESTTPDVFWKPLLPSLRGIRVDFPDVRIAVGYDDIPFLHEVATDIWPTPSLINEHAVTMSSIDMLLCYEQPIQSFSVYEAAQWGGVVIADPSYAHIVRSKGVLAGPEDLYDTVAHLLHNPAKCKVKSQALTTHVNTRKTLLQSIPQMVMAWQSLYAEKIGAIEPANTH